MLFYSILGGVLPLQEVALRQSLPSFSVLCYPRPYRSLLSHNVISPTTFWTSDRSFTLCLPLCASNSLFIVFHSDDVSSPFPFRIGYVLDYVTPRRWCYEFCFFCLKFSSLLSIARWLVSGFFTNAFVRGHVWHPYVIAGKAHWLKTFLFRLIGRCQSRKISLYFPKTLHPAFILIETSCFVLFLINVCTYNLSLQPGEILHPL